MLTEELGRKTAPSLYKIVLFNQVFRVANVKVNKQFERKELPTCVVWNAQECDRK